MDGLKDKVIVFAGAGGIATATAKYLGEGGAKVVVNVAANISPEEVARDTNVVDIELDAWRRTLDVNLTGYMLTCKHAIPHIIAAGGGSVVNTISAAVYGGMQTNVAYQATKAGVGALTRHIARKYGKQRVRANSVSPGLVLTEQTKRHLPQDFRDEVLRTTPSFRHGEPADIGAMSAFLLSDLGEWVTGQAICVDGGATMRP